MSELPTPVVPAKAGAAKLAEDVRNAMTYRSIGENADYLRRFADEMARSCARSQREYSDPGIAMDVLCTAISLSGRRHSNITEVIGNLMLASHGDPWASRDVLHVFDGLDGIEIAKATEHIVAMAERRRTDQARLDELRSLPG